MLGGRDEHYTTLFAWDNFMLKCQLLTPSQASVHLDDQIPSRYATLS